MNEIVIGIHSTRQCGKDTLFRHLNALDARFQRFAFADELKRDLHPFILKHFGFDIWTCTAAQKELVRPLLIAYGCAQREVDIDHWAKKVVEQINIEGLKRDIIPVVTDVRFESEYHLLRKAFGKAFILVDLTRIDSPEPTEEEKKHYLTVAGLADYLVHWGHDTEEQQLSHARNLLERFKL